MNSEIELLAPAGSYEIMKAAFRAGADAVYMGGPKFGARAYADNPPTDLYIRAIDYAHLYGKRLYLTLNTLIKEHEIKEELINYLKPFYEAGLDAVIVQDIGLIYFIKKNFPGLEIHASTQLTITGPDGALAARQLGVSRIITARELSLTEINHIKNEVDIEIEAFVHGALCYCYSGQCLMSSLIGGRSGNRGRCAQPCRLPYIVENKTGVSGNKQYPLNLKDLCGLSSLPQLIRAGVTSFKIEGRMKGAEYTSGVTGIYRKYLDRYLASPDVEFTVAPADIARLSDLFDRGGFTDSYFYNHNDKNMIALGMRPAHRAVDEEFRSSLHDKYIDRERLLPLKGRILLNKGNAAALTASFSEQRFNNLSVTVKSEKSVEAAFSQPLTDKDILKQLKKTGNTLYFWESLDIISEDSIFIPLKELNQVRRSALECLENEYLRQYKRIMPPLTETTNETASGQPKCDAMKIHVSIEDENLIYGLAKLEGISAIYLDMAQLSMEKLTFYVRLCHDNHKQCILSLPHIFREKTVRYLDKWEAVICSSGVDGFLLKTIDAAGFVLKKDWHGIRILDHTLYTWNTQSFKVFDEWDIRYDTAPVELNEKELKQRGVSDSELIVYGRLPVMVSAGCIQNTTERCRGQSQIQFLKDRRYKKFLIKNNCNFCYNTIYNADVLSLFDCQKAVGLLKPMSLRLQFTDESPQSAVRITKAFVQKFIQGKEAELPAEVYTRGHFRRGVE